MANKKSGEKRPANLSLERRMAKHGWVFVSPVLIGFVLLYAEILANSLWFGFNDMSPGDSSYVLTWVGLKHFNHALFVDTEYVRNLTNTILSILVDIPLIILFSLFIATLLSRKIAGKSFFRAVFFIPAVVITGAVAAGGNNELVSSIGEMQGIETGAANELFTMQELQNLLGGAILSGGLYDYILSAVNNIFGVINKCGVQIIVFIAGLQSISPSVYEAASIEGANGWDCYWKITFPMIGPIIYVNVVYTIVDSFVGTDNHIMSTIYRTGVQESRVGYASAMAWIYFVVILAILGLSVLLINKVIMRRMKD